MKKLGFFMVLCSVFFLSINSGEGKTKKTEKGKKAYVCPMKSHQYILHPGKGKCVKCKMKLVLKKQSATYQCPMKCKNLQFTKKGSCPICNMTTKMAKRAGKNTYVCPMKSHQYILHPGKGKCVKCKMTLIAGKQSTLYVCPMGCKNLKFTKKSKCPICNMTTKAIQTATIYTCPMHSQIRSKKPGSCPLCKMTLVPVKQSSKKGKKSCCGK